MPPPCRSTLLHPRIHRRAHWEYAREFEDTWQEGTAWCQSRLQKSVLQPYASKPLHPQIRRRTRIVQTLEIHEEIRRHTVRVNGLVPKLAPKIRTQPLSLQAPVSVCTPAGVQPQGVTLKVPVHWWYGPRWKGDRELRSEDAHLGPVYAVSVLALMKAALVRVAYCLLFELPGAYVQGRRLVGNAEPKVAMVRVLVLMACDVFDPCDTL